MLSYEFEQLMPMHGRFERGNLEPVAERRHTQTNRDTRMNILKGFKDMAAMVNAAPDMISSAQELQANAQAQQAAYEAAAATAAANAYAANDAKAGN
jgi:hypothetical protein